MTAAKKFKINYRQRGVTKELVFIVDQEDAYRVRAGGWRVVPDGQGTPYIRRSVATGVTEALYAKIVGAKESEFVAFKNGNTLDMRKENLVVMPKSEKAKWLAKVRAAA